MLPALNENGDLPPGVHAAGWPEIGLRFGSFVSAAPAPRDVDLILIMRQEFRLEDCPRETLTLFSHADAEARYGASVFWLREGMLPGAAMREFLRVWQTKRDGTVRGILEVA